MDAIGTDTERTWRGYIVLSNLPVQLETRQRVYSANLSTGLRQHPQPSHITHGRVSLDGSKQIVEGVWTERELAEMRRDVARDAGLSKSAEDALVFMQLGGAKATWTESHEAVLAYLRDNRDEWEPREETGKETR